MNREELVINAALSCYRQEDFSEDSIRRWLNCYDYINNLFEQITVDDVENMGKIISPKNHGFRCTPVSFFGGKSGVPYVHIRRLLRSLLLSSGEISPEEFYKEFEEIHPFNDGNGRVGEIIYWYMTGNFNPPNFWK